MVNAPVPSMNKKDSEILIVGLAPGFKGANKTGRPFTGDFAGQVLFNTLRKHKFLRGKYNENAKDDLRLINCSITNAVRCVPPKNLPKTTEIKGQDGKNHEVEMWKYWFLQEGILGVEADYLRTNEGKQPPVIHVDTDAPLYSDMSGKLLTDELWGIYYKPDIEGLGVQGGTSPYIVEKHFDQVNVDPYGVESPEYQTTDKFADMWTSALAHCQKRFVGKSKLYRKGPSGGLGCLTPDSFPIFDRFFENVYMIADANHGYKMIGVGHLVAQEILGTESELLKPFRFNRYAKGELHPTSNSPFPWS